MDKRGLTIDPNSEEIQPRWWEQIGGSQSPSPYATASWVYRHSWITEEKAQSTTDPIEYELDNGSSFANHRPGDTYDSGFFNTPRTGALMLDEGGFSQTGDPLVYVKHYFGTMSVYDAKASYPAPQQLEQRLVPGDKTVGYLGTIMDIRDALIQDNSDDILNPIPNPNRILNSGEFDRAGPGITLNEMEFLVLPTGIQLIINYTQSEVPDYDDDDDARGTLLGQVNYEISGANLTITDWSHYNWHNSQPVKKAVKVLINEKPDCAEVVMVENQPTPFWKSLGFECPYKGSPILVHRDSLKEFSTY